MPVRSEITGEKFGLLTALRTVGQSKTGKYIWLCRCDCGKERAVKIDNLTSGHTRSCGCLVSKRKQTPDEANLKRRATTKKWHDTHRIEVKAYRRRRAMRMHGLSVEQYEELLEQQDHRCAVCKLPSRFTFQVDHDHRCCPGVYSCGRCIRGLVCISCNRALGLFKDSPEMLRQAAEYLERFGAVTTERGKGASLMLQSELHGDMQSAAEMTAPEKIQ